MSAPESDGLGGTTSTTLGDPPPREPPKPTAQPSMSESLARLVDIAERNEATLEELTSFVGVLVQNSAPPGVLLSTIGNVIGADEDLGQPDPRVFLRTHSDAVVELVRAALAFGPLAMDYANASDLGEWLNHHSGALGEARNALGFAARRLVDPGAPGLYGSTAPAPAPTADLPNDENGFPC